MGREYKLPDILLITFVIILFIWTIDLEPDKELEIYQQELIRKESWLLSELDNIANFMSFRRSEYDYANREVWFYSWYYGYDFDKDRLLQLHDYLLRKDWVDITNQTDKNDYMARTIEKSDETVEHMRILCNDKATILLYMTDMQKDTEYESSNIRTLIELLYDYNLPCYDLNKE